MTPMVIADPNFDLDIQDILSESQSSMRQSQDLRGQELSFKRLWGTKQEGDEIALMLNVLACSGDTALESTLKEIHSPHILHIATHGLFLPDQIRNEKVYDAFNIQPQATTQNKLEQLFLHPPENPLLRSSIVLAGVNTWSKGIPLLAEAEDGLLTAEDVTGIDLLNTELVVLSACETGLGHVRIGEGIFGLQRAFMLAGARTLIMSLWKVSDQQTQELMIDFYKHILKKQGCAEGLREAQLALKKQLVHPRYWGAFICHGNPMALS
jgi:CHAT domain-containing protein